MLVSSDFQSLLLAGRQKLEMCGKELNSMEKLSCIQNIEINALSGCMLQVIKR